MAIQSTCSGCGRLLAVDDAYAGRSARCPACGQVYTVPSPVSSAPLVPPSPESTNDLFPGEMVNAPAPPPPPNVPPNVPPTEAQPQAGPQYWMLTTDQTQYGPVDRETLTRWYNEGRIAPEYKIREGEYGAWQPSEVFRPTVNPYAALPIESQQASFGPRIQNYPKADQSGIVLAMGILSWLLCPIFGVVAWVMGSNGLRDIAAGLTDPANKGLMQVGYYLGMVHVLLLLLSCGGISVLMAIGSIR
jgi:hypothetical protein